MLKQAWSLFCTQVKWFQVLLYNGHNLTSVICLHIVCSVWPLSGATTLSQSGPGSNGNERILHILQISKTGALPSDGLMSYPGHSLAGRSNPSAEMQLVYSTAPGDFSRIWTHGADAISFSDNHYTKHILYT